MVILVVVLCGLPFGSADVSYDDAVAGNLCDGLALANSLSLDGCNPSSVSQLAGARPVNGSYRTAASFYFRARVDAAFEGCADTQKRYNWSGVCDLSSKAKTCQLCAGNRTAIIYWPCPCCCALRAPVWKCRCKLR